MTIQRSLMKCILISFCLYMFISINLIGCGSDDTYTITIVNRSVWELTVFLDSTAQYHFVEPGAPSEHYEIDNVSKGTHVVEVRVDGQDISTTALQVGEHNPTPSVYVYNRDLEEILRYTITLKNGLDQTVVVLLNHSLSMRLDPGEYGTFDDVEVGYHELTVRGKIHGTPETIRSTQVYVNSDIVWEIIPLV